MWMVRRKCVHGWWVCIVDKTGIDRQSGRFRRGVSEYNCLVGKLIIDNYGKGCSTQRNQRPVICP